jgi:hypothetical protein
MDSLLTTVLGLGVRIFIQFTMRGNLRLGTPLVGLWEGIVLHHYDKQKTAAFDHYIAYAFRIVVDLCFTESLSRTLLILLWTDLGIVLSHIVMSVNHDQKRTKSRPARTTLSRPSKQAGHSRPRVDSAKDQRLSRSDNILLGRSSGTISTVKFNVDSQPPFPRSSPSSIDVSIEEISLHVPELQPRHPSEQSKSNDSVRHNPEHYDFSSAQPVAESSPAPLPVSLNPRLSQSPAAGHGPIIPVDPVNIVSEEHLTPRTLISALVQSNQLPVIHDDESQDHTPTPRTVGLPELEPPFISSDNVEDPIIEGQHDVPSIVPTIPSNRPSPELPVPKILECEDLPSSPCIQEAQHPLSPILVNTVFLDPFDHIVGETIPDKPASDIVSDIISVCGSEQTLGDRESIITVGSRDLVISRASDLREQAITEERERDRLRTAMWTSFSAGRIKEGILLEGEVEDAEEKSKKLHERAARRYFHGAHLLLMHDVGLSLSSQLII